MDQESIGMELSNDYVDLAPWLHRTALIRKGYPIHPARFGPTASICFAGLLRQWGEQFDTGTRVYQKRLVPLVIERFGLDRVEYAVAKANALAGVH